MSEAVAEPTGSAGVVHDWLYRHPPRGMTRRKADRIWELIARAGSHHANPVAAKLGYLGLRIGAGASFHGGRLATDGPESPHLLVPEMQASFLFAIAENDDEREPEAKNILRQSFDAAGLPAEIEVYEGALHEERRWRTKA